MREVKNARVGEHIIHRYRRKSPFNISGKKKLLLLTLSTSIVFLRERYQTNLNHLCLTFSFDLNSSFKLSNCFRSFRRFSLKTILIIIITQQTNANFIHISYIKRTEDKSEQFWRY